MYAEIKLMFDANEIKTYDDFKCLDQESIYLLDRVTNIGATTRFKNFQAKRVNDTRGYISFMEESGDTAMADDPTTWVKRNFERWKRKGKPSGSTTPTVTNVNTTGTATTTAPEKQQKTNDNKLQSWNKGKVCAKDYPVLEHDEFYTEWIVKMIQQIKLDIWERMIDNTFDTKTLRPGTDNDLYTL